MTAEKTDLQKLENLLNSATNERQRKMYLSLLNKARAELGPDSSPSEQKTTESLTSAGRGASKPNRSSTETNRKNIQSPPDTPTSPSGVDPYYPAKTGRIGTRECASVTEKTKTTASTKKKARGKSSKNKASLVDDSTTASKKRSSKVNATSKKEKTSSKDDSIVVTQEVSATNNSTSVPKTNQMKEDKGSAKTKTKSKAKKQSKQTKSSNKATSSPASSSTNEAIFQGVGIIKCTPYLEDEKLFVKIDEQQYELQKVVGAWQTRIDLLKSELEQNGSREMLLRVYPNITHFTDGRPSYHLFRLVQFYAHEEQYPDVPEEFIFRGIWRVVSYCPSPVITIHRNINRLGVYKNLSSVAQKYYAKSQDFPVVWDAPVEPFKYDPKLKKSEQMPCYFVQVRATLKDGQYIVQEMLSEPTLNIPRFIKQSKKNRNSHNKSKQTDQSNKEI